MTSESLGRSGVDSNSSLASRALSSKSLPDSGCRTSTRSLEGLSSKSLSDSAAGTSAEEPTIGLDRTAVSPEPAAGRQEPMIGRVVLDQGHVRVAGLLEVGVGRGEANVGVAGPLDVVGHEPDVGVAGELAAGLHADDHRARAGHRVGGNREVVEQDVVLGAALRDRAFRRADLYEEMSIVSAPRSGLATPS